MKIGLVGIGKMGYNIALNMKDKGHEVVAYDKSIESVRRIEKEGIKATSNLKELVRILPERKVIWIMVPSGDPVDETINYLYDFLGKEDIVIDGGNSHYKDTLRRYELLQKKEISFVDVGTSGGVEGARNGMCGMVGADYEVFNYIEPLLKDISVEKGYIHTGKTGSGHYVKMIHNAIEYGMMQAIGEGFEVLKKAPFELNLVDVSRVWNHGSVIRSWLMELTQQLLTKDSSLDSIRGKIKSSGEGIWALHEALELGVSTPVTALSQFTRFSSEQEDSFSNKIVAGLRNEFGGHSVTRK
ncbi:decarboxylating 6-phosphogluconate dehydrogenase [Herbivorax sp. ANBcel31]|uniref:phosphogluconate dehydrogenase (NAD(+)-dependent, decarboxylating) n=1 Tax=Herbivorax sp. ANBcel31 TaxID=3069754 RepID=UPI0027B30AE7|nr:decarboxylating 6-phosphogluconate dehydrogenase [Herbivorax sp. ANBcel31]MDQ2085196.1 decarboxylating 6-phosphogluconate dehydrogenase [Herbivorax sp. ANBcel31]